MGDYNTAQENFWAGNFGDEYIKRNNDEFLQASNLAFWARILRLAADARSVLELGANIGLNLKAIRRLLPAAKLSGLEINEKATAILKEWGGAEVFPGSILAFQPERKWDFVFTKGVLIHMPPEALPAVYDRMYEASSRYILVAEYYNPSPMEIPYRGNNGVLFKRDFAGELLERYDDLKLLDYGFVWKRDAFPQDDITWFLLKKD